MNVSRTERRGLASTWSRTRWRTAWRGRWRTSRPTSRGCRRCWPALTSRSRPTTACRTSSTATWSTRTWLWRSTETVLRCTTTPLISSITMVSRRRMLAAAFLSPGQSSAKTTWRNPNVSPGRAQIDLDISPFLAGRAGTRQLRYDVNNLINNAASDMSVHWNKTNRAFTDRISEAQDAHRNLKSNLILTKNVSTSRLSLHQLLHYLVGRCRYILTSNNSFALY